MENSNLFSLLTKLFGAYISLLVFIVSIKRPLLDMHENILSRPEIILMGGYFYVATTLDNKKLGIYSIIIYCLSSIINNNSIDNYNRAFGSFAPLIIKISKFFGFLKDDYITDSEEFDSDSDFNF